MAGPPTDPALLALIIHDLRNPLNAIGMALHMIEGELPEGCDDLRQDVAMIGESARSLRRMLKILGDYNQLVGGPGIPAPHPFDPRRLVSDAVAEATERPEGGSARVHLEVGEAAPAEVELDQAWCRLALIHALSNAMEASGGSEVRVTVTGAPGRWRTRIVTEQPPADSVRGGPLGDELPRRLVGSPHERRGLDLAIVSQVTDRLGGTARLELEPGLRSALVLDWPVRAAAGGGQSVIAGVDAVRAGGVLGPTRP
jgi:signal transduction histidine kinase